MTAELLSGNGAQAEAVRLARAQVIAAYPITPQTTIVERLAEMVERGELAAQYVRVESEHSALMAVVAASALGARTYTATSSQGLLLMHEVLHWASGLRAPIVMGVVNRAVAPPWSLGADHTDTMAQRDTGWIQFYPESNQEVLDTVVGAYRLAEDPAIRLPAMVAEDAFYLSHTLEPVDVPDPAIVDGFLPPRARTGTLAPEKATRLGSFTGPAEYVAFRKSTAEAMDRVPARLAQLEREFAETFGRAPGDSVECYRAEDAEAVLMTMGTATTTARSVVDELRAAGQRVGLAKIRLFRPFPRAAVRALAAFVPRIGVLDRSYTFGGMGSAATEVKGALYDLDDRPAVASFLAGIGGRDVTPALLRQAFRTLQRRPTSGPAWLDLAPAETEEVVHG